MSSRGRRRQGPGLAPRPGPSQGQEPAGPSPVGPSPVGPSPVGPSPVGPSPVGPSPVGPSPVGPAPVGPSPVGPAQLGWALLVIAAALIGGLAAAALVHTSLTIAVIVSVVAGGIAVLAAFRSPARPPELRAGVPSQSPQSPQAPQLPQAPQSPQACQPAWADPLAPGAQAVPPASFASPGSDPTVPVPAETDGQARGGPPAGHQTVVQLLPLPPQPGNAEPPDAPWWDSAQGAPPPPSPGAKRVPAPDLSTYLASTFIAQCPRCGAFRLDIQSASGAWDFRCEACGHAWTWQPGTPWPPVRVMPRGRRE